MDNCPSMFPPYEPSLKPPLTLPLLGTAPHTSDLFPARSTVFSCTRVSGPRFRSSGEHVAASHRCLLTAPGTTVAFDMRLLSTRTCIPLNTYPQRSPFYRRHRARSRPRATRGDFQSWEKEPDFSGPVQVANSACPCELPRSTVVPMAAMSQVNKFGKHINIDD